MTARMKGKFLDMLIPTLPRLEKEMLVISIEKIVDPLLLNLGGKRSTNRETRRIRQPNPREASGKSALIG